MRYVYQIELEQGSLTLPVSVTITRLAPCRCCGELEEQCADRAEKNHESISEALAWAAEVIRREEERC